jgi:hypothetical protein
MLRKLHKNFNEALLIHPTFLKSVNGKKLVNGEQWVVLTQNKDFFPTQNLQN